MSELGQPTAAKNGNAGMVPQPATPVGFGLDPGDLRLGREIRPEEVENKLPRSGLGGLS